MKNTNIIRIWVFALFLLISSVTQAQYYYMVRGHVEGRLGVAMPLFNFGDKNGTQLARHANVGINAGGSIAYLYSRHVGLEFDINYNRNGVNETSLANAYLQVDTINNLSSSASSGSFNDISGAVGLRFDLPVNEYFSFVFKMTGGLRSVYKPSATISVVTIEGTEKFTETSDNQIIFALYSSMGGKIQINDQLGINFAASYIGSKLDFEYAKNGAVTSENIHIGVLMLTAGIGYSF
ncbi:MAG: hypothetical protein K9G61_07445 [Bacteroidales bacterium]|nr:hypothetical protein [Bacteroidales bacterium]